MLEGVPAMLWLGDAQGKCLFLNRAQREFWGVGIDEISTFSWARTLHPDDLSHLQSTFGKAMANQLDFEVEARYKRADGVYRLLHTSARPRFSATGEFLGMSGVNADVTERRASEQRVAMLTQELSHRIKNLFSVVGALISVTKRENAASSTAMESLRRRVFALSAAYDNTHALAAHESSRNLGDLVQMVLAPFQPIHSFSSRGLDYQLTPKTTASLALILNELVTNSSKYGSLSSQGSLEITASEIDREWNLITWAEKPVERSQPSSDEGGFGSQLLEFAARDIGAELTREWRGETLVIGIMIPREKTAE
ncbi:sensor histidine kinase [Seohaeicola nanhaiensis]|uniref:histidine kinase n=1 Tax=Seohaeicola nanhaiensis TaxID=1387282 RepID=A0ABV9KHM1_9RHOB